MTLRLDEEAVSYLEFRGEVLGDFMLQREQALSPRRHLHAQADMVGGEADPRVDDLELVAAVLADPGLFLMVHDNSCTHRASSVEHPPRADSAEQRTPGKPDPPKRKDRSE